MAKQYHTYTDESLDEEVEFSKEQALYWQDAYQQAIAEGWRGKNWGSRNYYDKTARTKWKRHFRLRDEKMFRLLSRAGCTCTPPKLPTRYYPPKPFACLKCGKRATWQPLMQSG